MAVNNNPGSAGFTDADKRELGRYGLNARQTRALESILPALWLITLPHRSMVGALRNIDNGHYIHIPHYVSLPAQGKKAPGGANPDAIELIYRELFHVAVSPAEGDARPLSPFHQYESDLVQRHRVSRSQVARRESLLSVRSDIHSAFFKIASLCYWAAGMKTGPERAIRAWLSRRRLPDTDCDVVEPEEAKRSAETAGAALRLLNKKKGRPEDYDPAADMFMRLRRQWVMDNPDMPKKLRRAMAAGIPGLEDIARPVKKASTPKVVKKAARSKPKSWK